VYVTGRTGINAATEFAFYKHKQFAEAIKSLVSDVKKIDVKKQSMRIVCRTEQQVETLLKQEMFLDREVVVSRPFNMQSDDVARKTWVKGVIKPVPIQLDDSYIQKETGAIWVHRITRPAKEGLAKTLAVIVAFEQSRPDTLRIGSVNFKVKHYNAKPTRCMRCQAFSHKKAQCHAKKNRNARSAPENTNTRLALFRK